MALSFDALASPAVQFEDVPTTQVAGRVPCGWGFGWYPEGDATAAIVKDPTSTGNDAMAQVLHDWNRFRSTVFVSFVMGAARRRTQQDTHPFSIRYAGRDWVLTHNGTLNHFWEKLSLGDPPLFEPAGHTDSEHVLCFIVTRMRDAGARRMADFGWVLLYDLFGAINTAGTSNFMLTDGLDLVVYHDKAGFNDIHWTRQAPPYSNTQVKMGLVRLDLQDIAQGSRTMVLFSSKQSEDDGWHQMAPGQMLVVRRGSIIWDSQYGARPPAARSVYVSTSTPPTPHSPQTAWGDRRGREIRVTHDTVYRYARPVEKSQHVLRLQPVHDPLQDLMEFDMHVSVDGTQRHFEDVFGNRSVELEVDEPFEEFRVTTTSLVRLYTRAYDALEFPNRRCSIPLVWMPWQRQMMSPFLLPPELPESELIELSEFAMAAVERNDYDLLETLLDLNQTIFVDFEYVPMSTTLQTTPYEVFCSRKGVCQDFSNLLICLARLLNVPARYRVGYIVTGADYANQIQAEASHAWVELYLPWIGWRGFDPTNGFMTGADHIRVACGRNYRDATPTAGTIFRGGGGETLNVSVRVEVTSEPT